MTLHLNIGTNLGDRRSNLERAVAALVARFGPVRLSPVEESEPWGFESQNRFLNVGVAVEVADDADPLRLLDIVQDAERSVDSSLHRNADGTYRDRVVDIDMIVLGNRQVNHPRLTLPHPRMRYRTFVMRPYKWLEDHPGDSCPLLNHPREGTSHFETSICKKNT